MNCDFSKTQSGPPPSSIAAQLKDDLSPMGQIVMPAPMGNSAGSTLNTTGRQASASEQRTNRTYAPRRDAGFKRSAVERWLQSGKAARVVAKELGIHFWNLSYWKKKYGPQDSSLLAMRIARLELENCELRRQLLLARQRIELLKCLTHPLPGHRHGLSFGQIEKCIDSQATRITSTGNAARCATTRVEGS